MDEDEDFERVKRLLRTCADAGKGLDAGGEARAAAHDLARLVRSGEIRDFEYDDEFYALVPNAVLSAWIQPACPYLPDMYEFATRVMQFPEYDHARAAHSMTKRYAKAAVRRAAQAGLNEQPHAALLVRLAYQHAPHLRAFMRAAIGAALLGIKGTSGAHAEAASTRARAENEAKAQQDKAPAPQRPRGAAMGVMPGAAAGARGSASTRPVAVGSASAGPAAGQLGKPRPPRAAAPGRAPGAMAPPPSVSSGPLAAAGAAARPPPPPASTTAAAGGGADAAAGADAVWRPAPSVHNASPLLRLVADIAQGMSAAGGALADPGVRSLLNDVLLPMHEAEGMLGDTQALLSVYHRDLVLALVRALEACGPLERDEQGVPEAHKGRDATLVHVFTRLLHYFPSAQRANSPKAVLLVHEVEELLKFASHAAFAEIQFPLVTALLTWLCSDYSRLAQRALQLWSAKHFLALAMAPSAVRFMLPRLLPALLRGGQKHWNPTVNRMRANVLNEYDERAHDEFAAVAASHLSADPEAAVARVRAIVEDFAPPRDKTPAEERDTSMDGLPTNLEDVAFFDFVFGRDLGSGSFATVRYAKLIRKGSSLSHWREFALKQFDMQRAREHQFDGAIRREVEVMRQLSHPNVCRLLGSFAYKDSLFLVLEYCEKGDLHSQLLTMGSVDEATGRFVVGELVAALAHVHEQGVLYGDLKPENILVHSSGHIKLSDFGSARRMDSIQAGDRVEGTAEYLPPEVVHGDAPSLAADMWALGCVVYQLFAGRPPLWAEQQGDLFRQIVSFDVGDAFPPSFPEPAADLVRLLLQTDPGARPTVAEVRKHRFFEGMDVMRLHEQTAPEFARGAVAARPNEGWARRKNSMMLCVCRQQGPMGQLRGVSNAPMPVAYDFSNDGGGGGGGSIPEGADEAGAAWHA